MDREGTDVTRYCDRCGKVAIGEVGDEFFCETCYHGETSCCGRFSDDD